MQPKSTEFLNSLVAKLQPEANSFVNARAAIACEKPNVFQAIANLTGIDLRDSGDEIQPKLNDVLQRLQSGLRQERRNSRAGSPLYDSNRHIALNEAFKAISAIQNNKTPTW